MATVEACRAALDRLTAQLAANAEQIRERVRIDRTMVCRVTDLNIAFRGRLVDGELRDLTEGDDPRADITLAAASDDLIALVDGGLDFGRALAARRVTLRASPFDLLKLRKLW